MTEQIISIKVDTNNLVEVCQNANIGQGTFSNPIGADSFAELVDFDKIKDDTEKITFKLSNNGQGIAPELLSITLKNVGKDDVVLSDLKVAELYSQIFIPYDNTHIDGRLLCIDPSKPNEAELFPNPSAKNGISYFSFTTIFKLDINGIPCCFSIDPVLRVSRHRP